MPATVRSATIIGLEVIPVDVEVEVLPGLPSVTIVGLPDAAVKEARERLTAALVNSGFVPPRHRTIVNLAPAHVRKEGSQFDLPIALAYLQATNQCAATLTNVLAIGSLALDGSLRPILGAVALAESARRRGQTILIVPPDNTAEACIVHHEVVAPPTLRALVDHLEGRASLPTAHAPDERNTATGSQEPDFASVAGQEFAKRAMEIAAAGGHNVLLHGPPGSGKTLLAQAFPGILPQLSDTEALEVTKIYSVRGILPRDGTLLIRQRPFRAPHHSTSAVALIGGGSTPQPGEVTLAHRGVLFLDEFAEFPRMVLDHLRQPLEEGEVTVSRAAGTVRFPARFSLIAAMNPCPCGYAGDPHRSCVCTPGGVAKYQQRISGPLLDRIDLHVHVAAIPADTVLEAASGEPSTVIRARVENARRWQRERYESARTNASLVSREIPTHCAIPAEARELLVRAAETLRLSARGLHRVLKISRTIADLGGVERIELPHLAEALQYRAPLPSA